MNKKELQTRILHNGKPLALIKFSWCEKTKTFSSEEDYLVIDFFNISNVTIKAGRSSTIKAGDYVTIKAGRSSTIKAGDYVTINTGYSSTINTGYYSTINTGYYSTINTGNSSTIKAGRFSTINTGNSSTIKAGDSSTINTGDSSTINTGDSSTINTGYSSTINTGYSSTITDCGKETVIIRRDFFEVIQPLEGDTIQLCPFNIKGYLKNGSYSETGEKAIFADNILSFIKNKKGNVYKVQNQGEESTSYLIEDNGIYSHGKTIKEARESLLFKIGDRDKSAYKEFTLDTEITLAESISMYRIITGACEHGTKSFVNSLKETKENYTVSEIIDLTKGQFGNLTLIEFINNKGERR